MNAIAPDGTAFELTGPKGAPVVVLIHGLGLNRECWQWTIPALSDRYRVLTYDLYGHGQSAIPPEEPSLSLFSRQLADLLGHCGASTASIAGFSLGGMIARRFAQDTPERTDALIVLHSPHLRTEDAQAAIVKRVVQACKEGPQSTVEAALDRWFTAPYRDANPEVMDLVRSWVTANSKDIYHTIYHVLAEGVAEIVSPNPPITCPALIITGDQDYGNGPEMTQAIGSEISGAEVLILLGLRHMALVEDPVAINSPVRSFLDKHLVPA